MLLHFPIGPHHPTTVLSFLISQTTSLLLISIEYRIHKCGESDQRKERVSVMLITSSSVRVVEVRVIEVSMIKSAYVLKSLVFGVKKKQI